MKGFYFMQQLMPLGTIVNVITILCGSTIGLILHNRFPDKIKNIIFQGLGLCTFVIGMQMTLKVTNLLTLIFAVLIGGIIGEAIDLDKKLNKLIAFFQKKETDNIFAEGLITAFLLFCIGSMTIVGSLNEGLRSDHTLLLTKATLDGFSSIALASTYGIGVIFSVIPLFLFQGGITVLALYFHNVFSPLLITQITATGGILVLAVALGLLDIKKIKVTNLLPALLVIIFFTLI